MKKNERAVAVRHGNLRLVTRRDANKLCKQAFRAFFSPQQQHCEHQLHQTPATSDIRSTKTEQHAMAPKQRIAHKCRTSHPPRKKKKNSATATATATKETKSTEQRRRKRRQQQPIQQLNLLLFVLFEAARPVPKDLSSDGVVKVLSLRGIVGNLTPLQVLRSSIVAQARARRWR